VARDDSLNDLKSGVAQDGEVPPAELAAGGPAGAVQIRQQ